MNRNYQRIFSCALFLVVFALAAKAQNRQMIFNAEEPVSQNVSLPDAVLAVLKSERRVDACFREKGAEADETDWFEASQFDLNGDRRLDLIVKAKDGCLFGANQAPFWIFQNLSDGYQKIFSATGLQLAILPSKTNHFNLIKISAAVAMKPASRTFRFLKNSYQPTR